MISSISQRLPRKISGLFDTGFAGSAFDITSSFDQSIPADIDESLFTFADYSPNTNIVTESKESSSTVFRNDMDMKTNLASAPELIDLDFDLMDPLGGLDDPLGNDNLDAFVNLDSFLMENTFLYDDGQSALKQESEVQKPVPTDLFATPAEVKPVIQIPFAGTSYFDEVFAPIASSSTKVNRSSPKSSYKRKAEIPAEPLAGTSGYKLAKVTNDAKVDHDYISKGQTSLVPQIASKELGKSKVSKQIKLSTSSGDIEIDQLSTIEVTGLDKTVDKQTIRRLKNNVASKRSRQQKKVKLAEMDQEAENLIVENERLRKLIIELEAQAKEMKAKLVAKMTGQC